MLTIEDQWRAIVRQTTQKNDRDTHSGIFDEMISELSYIYHEYKGHISYQPSTKESEVGFNPKTKTPFIIIDKKIKDNLIVQAALVHELTHLAQVESKIGRLNVYFTNKIELVEAMMPDTPYPNEQIDELLDVLNRSEFSDKSYIEERLGYAINYIHEQPTVFMEILYCLRSTDRIGDFYYKIEETAYWFFQQRCDRRRLRMG